MSELVLLGTGSADGWPNPFCTCASCLGARDRGEVRGQSAALLDGVVLLDCGPEAPRATVRAGRDLAEVRVVLLTHAHPDHTSPAPLLWRSWTGTSAPLVVAGPPDAVDAYGPWLGPDDPVTLVPVDPGSTQTLDLAGYACRPVPGSHETETALWDVTCPDGSRLLYATDTGPLGAQAVARVRDRGYDLLVLEETFGDRADHGTGHLDLTTFPRQLALLRDVGAVTAATRVVATHLSHHNPPAAELVDRLGAWGAEVHPDGTALPVRRDATDREAQGPPSPHLPSRGRSAGPGPLPRRTLVLGGARSGKSTHAERLLADRDDVVYVATAGARDGDVDWQARVDLHRVRRPASWDTEETTDVAGLLASPGPPLLVDCLSLWCTAALDRAGAWDQDRWHGGTAQESYRAEVDALLAAWRETQRQVVAVSNEVGSGVVPATWSGRLFRDELGRLNAAVARASERVELVVAGTVQRLRG